jgi:hypothetical protein
MTEESGFIESEILHHYAAQNDIVHSRREWMGVEPTAARNATRHRF